MHSILHFISSHPAITGAVVTAIESIAMPFIPIQYNGLAVTIFGFLKRKIGG